MPIFDSIADQNVQANRKVIAGWVDLFAEKDAEIRALHLVIQERESEISRLMAENKRWRHEEALRHN